MRMWEDADTARRKQQQQHQSSQDDSSITEATPETKQKQDNWTLSVEKKQKWIICLWLLGLCLLMMMMMIVRVRRRLDQLGVWWIRVVRSQ